MIYLDNAATSFPKPDKVIYAMTRAQSVFGANPGRGGHRMTMKAGQLVYSCRSALADFFSAPEERVIFTNNCTSALNTAIKGSVKNQYWIEGLNEGTYTFTREVKDNCEDWMPSEGEWTVVVYNAPDVTISGNININNGESTTLTASGADSYIWNTGETTESITVNPTENKEYSVVSEVFFALIMNEFKRIVEYNWIIDSVSIEIPTENEKIFERMKFYEYSRQNGCKWRIFVVK